MIAEPSSSKAATNHPASLLSYKWWVVLMLWFVCFLNYADRQAISSVLPLLEKNFGFNKVQLGLIGSAFAWVYAAAAPGAGLAADRFSRKRLLVAALIVWSLVTFATAGCNRFSFFLLVRALTGLGEAFYFPAAMALISDYHSAVTRSRAMSWHQSAVYAGTILGSWTAAVLAERAGWHLPFLLFGPVGILLALFLSWQLREPQRGASEPAPVAPGTTAASPLSVVETLQAIFRAPAAVLLMGAFICANFVAVMLLTWMPAFLVEEFHYTLGAAGLTGTLYIHLASAVAVPIAGSLADRLVRRWRAGRMAIQALGLILGAGFALLIGQTGSIGTLLVAMTCFGLCKGFYDSGIFASLYDVIDPRARGSAAGLINTFGWAGGALGPVFVGLACKYGGPSAQAASMSAAIAWGGLFYLAGAACLAAAMWLFVKPRAGLKKLYQPT